VGGGSKGESEGGGGGVGGSGASGEVERAFICSFFPFFIGACVMRQMIQRVLFDELISSQRRLVGVCS
jgi:hypothetical protein